MREISGEKWVDRKRGKKLNKVVGGGGNRLMQWSFPLPWALKTGRWAIF